MFVKLRMPCSLSPPLLPFSYYRQEYFAGFMLDDALPAQPASTRTIELACHSNRKAASLLTMLCWYLKSSIERDSPCR